MLAEHIKRMEELKGFKKFWWIRCNGFKVSWLWFGCTSRRQNYGCAICGADIAPPGMGCMPEEKACIDHDHKTGKPRGILCRMCNLGLGHFKDSPELLRKAAEYLERTDFLTEETAAELHESL